MLQRHSEQDDVILAIEREAVVEEVCFEEPPARVTAERRLVVLDEVWHGVDSRVHHVASRLQKPTHPHEVATGRVEQVDRAFAWN